ncbi:MAG: phosphoglycerate mutase, partial [Gallionellaceae bacterium]|nr:phosphoglycerate mutase [Gallionellaceae bacterium]
YLPQGPDALRWNKVFNEIQMLFFDHAVNRAREARGELPVNSVWLWGGGVLAQLRSPFSRVYGDSPLAAAFAQAANIPYTADRFTGLGNDGTVLIVWEDLRRALQQGDFYGWREAVQRLEKNVIAPLWQALAAGRIAQLTVDILNTGSACRLELTRANVWKLWCRSKPLAHYALV